MRSLAALVLLGTAAVGDGMACDWSESPPPERFKRSSKVFAGVVAPTDRRAHYSQPVKFIVEEAFKGVTRGTTILISPGSGDCANLFEPGNRYLIFASERIPNGLPEASKSSGSLPVSEAGAILRWLRGRAGARWSVNLLGMVWGVDAATLGRHANPLAGAEIRVTKNQVTAVAVSDSNGAYEFSGLAPGEYELLASFPGHREESRKVRVGESCAFADVWMWVDGHVGGIVRSDPGVAADGIRVELIPAEPNGEMLLFRQAQTKDGGQFLFQGIPPGEYLVAVNAIVSPTAQQPYAKTFSRISLERNQRHTGVLLRLPPPLPMKRVAVRAVMPNGAAAGGARLWISDVPGYAAPIEVRADDRGQASYSWVQGVASRLYAEAPGRSHAGRMIVKPSETSAEVKLTPLPR